MLNMKYDWKPSILGNKYGMSAQKLNNYMVSEGYLKKDNRGVLLPTRKGIPYAWYGWNDKSVEYPQLYYSDLVEDLICKYLKR